MDINKFINSLDQNRLDAGIRNIKKMMGTKEGQELMQKLQKVDKSELVRKLNSADSSVSNDRLMNELTNDPNLMEKLNAFLNSNK